MADKLPDGFVPDGFEPNDVPVQPPVIAKTATPDGFVPDGFQADSVAGSVDSVTTAPAGFTPDFATEQSTTGTESGILLDSELDKISKETGVPIEQLRSIAPYFGARSDKDDSLSAKAKRVAGFLDEAGSFGLVKGAYKKFATSPEEEKALDKIESLAQERKSGWETAGEIAGGVLVPGLGTAKVAKGLGTAAKVGLHALEGATIGGLSGYAKSGQDEGVRGAATGALLGGALGAAIPLAGKAFDGVKKLVAKSPEIVDRAEREIQERLATDAPRLDSQAKTITDTVNTGISPENPAVKKDLQNFLGYIKSDSLLDDPAVLSSIGPAKAVEGLQAVRNSMGDEWLGRELKNWQTSNIADDVLESKVAQVVPRDATIGRRAGRFLIDGRAAARRIDRLTGVTSLEPLMDEASRKMNQMKLAMHTTYTQAVPKMKEIAELGGNQLTAADIRTAEESGIAALRPEVRPAVERYQEFMTTGENSMLKQLQDMGIPLKELNPEKSSVYIPRLTVDAPEAISRVMDKARGLGINPKGEITPEQFANVMSSDVGQELVSGANWLSGRAIGNENDLSLALKEILSPASVTAKLKKKIRSAQGRQETGVPDFLRETDLSKLTGRYLHDTIEGATLQPIVQDLTLQGRLAKKAKDWDSADYIEKLTRDLNGQREGTLAAYTSKKADELILAAKDKASELRASGHDRRAAVADWVSQVPDFFSSIQRNVYPNFLGANPRAAINNLTQAFFVTAPEMGGAYGGNKVIKALGKTLAESRGLVGNGAIKSEMEASGQLGIQAHQEAYNALREGLVKSGGFSGVSRAVLDKASNAAMGVFELSERINRRIVSNVADDVAKDLTSKTTNSVVNANKFLENLGPAYKTRIDMARKSGNVSEVKRLVENYLTGKTMFNYNKLNMSEYGRTMGPFFSVFSKWPSAIAGDIVNTMGEKGALHGTIDNARRYLAPILAANMVESFTDFDKSDPRNKALFGSEGLSSAAPGRALTSIVGGDIFTPPGLDIAKKFATGVLTADPYAVWSAGNDAVAAYAPGAFVLRMLGTDIPRFQGDDPHGTMLGRLFPDADEAAKDARADIHDIIGK